MYRCPFCITRWVDRACTATGIRLRDLDRRRLIAALLSRPHLILSGPPGIGKRQLARALASSIADKRPSRIRSLQGHPWWAVGTGNVGYFVELQTDFSLSQLAGFVTAVLQSEEPASQDAQAESDNGNYVVCVERMSPVEIELYFRVVAEWLLENGQAASPSVPICLVGTYDSPTPPELDERILRMAALVHLHGAQQS